MIDIALDISDFAIRLGHGFKTDCERVSHEIRDKLSIARHERLKAKRLARALQVYVGTAEDIDWQTPAQMQELLAAASGSWSAFLIHAPGHPPAIIRNMQNNRERQESDIFHELAHLLCRHTPRGIKLIGGVPMWNYDEEQERQAEFLGYALHLSKDALFRSVKDGLDNQSIGSKYRASSSLVQMRINLTHVRHILKRAS